jgi:hypothetical protein
MITRLSNRHRHVPPYCATLAACLQRRRARRTNERDVGSFHCSRAACRVLRCVPACIAPRCHGATVPR